jgi:hypothetical protein
MNMIETVTRRPRNGDGDSSDIYRGTTRLAPPTANPTTLLPTIMPHTLVVHACHTAPATKRISAARMARFRPSLSASTPVKGLAMSAKREVHEVIRLLSRVERVCFDRSDPIETRVAEMTPVSSAIEVSTS